jgi:glucokinase
MTAGETIGVDLGGTKMATAVVDSEQRILHQSRERSTGLEQEQLLKELEAEVGEALEARPNAAAVGLGIPCTIDQERGVAITAVNLPIENLPIRDWLSERLPIPVFIDNDANLAAYAEYLYGAARGARVLVMLTIGTGIGGGVVIAGEVFHGSIGAGAELGHIVIERDGPRCQGNCPNHGCVESLASGTAIAREGRAAGERHPESALGRALREGGFDGGQTVTDAAQAGDRVAREVVAAAGSNLGVALASYANIFNPDLIVIGGGAAEGAGELLLEPAREQVRGRALPPMNETPVRAAELGGGAGMIGAAAMAAHELDAAS